MTRSVAQQTAAEISSEVPEVPAVPPSGGGSWLARILILPIRGYQLFISPALPPTCRFYPSCSQYAVEALRVHGALKGSWLTIRRIGRCHPWHWSGYDPVPPRKPGRGATDAMTEDRPTARRSEPSEASALPQERPAGAAASTAGSSAA